MSRNLYFAFGILLQILFTVHATGLYSVIGPGTIRSNFKYNVAVSLHKADQPCKFKVGITGPSYNETKEVELEPMSTKNVEFDVPELKTGDYNLTAMGISGITFENSTKLNHADYKPSVYIQTDKATYKPGDLVQFRVLVLDENTRPAKNIKPFTILISDGAQNRIKQWKNIEFVKGVHTGKFQLSEQPVLGNWVLEVVAEGESATTKTFEVAKYVLPKFEVIIETAKDVAVPTGIIKATIRSKYTYGKSVKGKATVSIMPQNMYYYTPSDYIMEAKKTIEVDGKAHVEFDLKKDFQLRDGTRFLPTLKMLVIMEEELTGNKQNTSTSINLHAESYKIEGVDVPFTYAPHKPLTYEIVVKNLDGSPVQDTKNKVKLSLEPAHNYFVRGYSPYSPMGSLPGKEEPKMEFESNLNEHGMAKFEIVVDNENVTYYSVKALYLDTTAYLASLSKFEKTAEAVEQLKIKVNTEKPRIGKDVSVEIVSNEFIPYFVYAIIARGNILKTEHVKVPSNTKSHIIKFTPTFEMMPNAKFYIHYVFDNDLRFEETNIKFENHFENNIDISAPAQTKPGEEVKLKIQTDPDSFVGLLGVDQSVLLLKSGNDLNKDDIFRDLSNYDTNTPYIRGYGKYPGQTSGVVTMTNANYPYNDVQIYYSMFNMIPTTAATEIYYTSTTTIPQTTQSHSLHSSNSIAVRKDFLENWIFDNNVNTDADGFTLAKKIPDTITSWVITGFSLNPKTGIALTEAPTKIQVFQPFFVSTNLPYSVKRGEVIAIPVVIFNYMDKNLDAEVTMDNTDGEYEFTEATNEIEEKTIDEVKRIKRVSVPSNSGKSVSFMIRPKKVGSLTLKITAITPLAGDAIHQMLKVEPEGITKYENRAVFVNLKEKSEVSQKLPIDIPKDVIPDSEYIEFSVVGDLLGPTIKNLDKLVRMPYGCGEQNMVNFVPNILVLKYLKAIGKSMPTVEEKAKKFLEIGYQRELTYKHDDGSYSAFGKSDKAGSTWLTAYVMRSFHQAANFTDIDPKVLEQGLDFLASKQAENGSFPEYGKLFDSAHQNELGLNAFVLLAFLENVEMAPKYSENIQKGMDFLLANVDKSDDQYSLSIAALALQLAKHPHAAKTLARLQGMAQQSNDRKWWSKSDEPKTEEASWYYRPRSNDVEITSYALLAMMETESTDEALPIVKWLISQRNSNGGFASTQDTVVGLQALIKFAEKTGSGTGEMNVDFVSSGGSEDKGSIKVNPENSLVLQTNVLPKSTRQVDFTAKGTGSCMVQLAYRYNVADKDKKPSFQVKTTVKDNTPPQLLIVDVCAEYVPLEAGSSSEKRESNMAVLEITLPSGFTADSDSFDKIGEVDRVKRTETKNSDSTVIVYFDGLPEGDKKCIPVQATKTHAVAKQKPAVVSIYDYYDTERRATEYYEVKSSLCDICEGEDCGKDCKK